jgi:hypothetical protein
MRAVTASACRRSDDHGNLALGQHDDIWSERPIHRRFRPVFTVLRTLKFLRGTPVDPFGFARVRRTERELIGEYRTMIEGLLANVAKYRARVAELTGAQRSITTSSGLACP